MRELTGPIIRCVQCSFCPKNIWLLCKYLIKCKTLLYSLIPSELSHFIRLLENFLQIVSSDKYLQTVGEQYNNRADFFSLLPREAIQT